MATNQAGAAQGDDGGHVSEASLSENTASQSLEASFRPAFSASRAKSSPSAPSTERASRIAARSTSRSVIDASSPEPGSVEGSSEDFSGFTLSTVLFSRLDSMLALAAAKWTVGIMRKQILAGAVAMVSAAALVYVASVRRADPGVDGVRARLDACIAADAVYGYREDCVQSVWDNAVRDGYLPTFVGVMEMFVAAHPKFEIPCHDQAHTAGIRAYETSGDGLKLVLEGISGTSVCDNGFLHGVMGELGRTRDPDRVAEIMTVCEQVPSPVQADCIHAVGHAVWPAVRDAGAAAELCSTYREPIRVHPCMSGVMMSVLSPQHDPAETPMYTDIDAAMTAYPALCRESGETLGEQWFLECFLPLGEAVVNHTALTLDIVRQTQRIDPQHIERLARNSLEYCVLLTEPSLRACRRGVYRAAVRRVSLGPGEVDRIHALLCDTRAAQSNDPGTCRKVLIESPLPADWFTG